jgi:GntR family transcriptional repressor for pyruvate dehydrogenase complex
MKNKYQTPLYEEVMLQLAELIRKGRFRPGDRLPAERDLAAQLKVSRATLREALRAMQLQGITQSRRGAGNYMTGGNAQDLALALDQLALHDIFELRLLIEPSIAALAAKRATPDDVSKLEAILRRQYQDLSGNKIIAETDSNFHSALAEATHNRALVKIGTTLLQIIAPSRNKRLQTPHRARLSLASHTAIVAAVDAHDAQRARSEMEEHLHAIDRGLFGLPKNTLAVSFPRLEEVTA